MANKTNMVLKRSRRKVLHFPLVSGYRLRRILLKKWKRAKHDGCSDTRYSSYTKRFRGQNGGSEVRILPPIQMDMFYAAGLPPEWLTQYATERSGSGRDVTPPNGNGSDSSVEDYKCKMCPQNFANLQECLKHELLDHSLVKKRPQKTLRNKLNMILKSFNEDEKQTLRTELREELDKCSPGKELATVFKSHRVKPENLEMIYFRILTCLERELSAIGTFKICPFGSIVNGLALKDSDIDLYIEHTNPQSPSHRLSSHSTPIKGRCSPLDRSPLSQDTFNKINFLLYRSPCFSDVISIRQARVPIIKCKHRPTGFSVDINLTCPSSVHNTNFVRDIVQLDSRLHELLIFLKIWAKQLQLIGRGNMTSYCLITLVIFYLQQPQRKHPAPLPSVKSLQSTISPLMVQGVNYAYNLNPHGPPMPRCLTVATLIRGFFAFYKQFDFEHSIIAPYLGTAVPLDRFKSGEFKYPAYENQQRAITILSETPAEPLQVERCMCVQDPFCLNHNIAKSMCPPNLEYFRKCLHHAQRICADPEVHTDAQLYEALLYGIVEQIARSAELDNCVGQSTISNQPSALNYRFTPCRAEMRALVSHTHTADNETLYRLWSHHYIEAIIEIITEIYLIDMQLASPLHGDKYQRMDDSHRTRTWLLSGTVDMWTGRLHMRNNGMSFMEYQLSQTEAFHRDRRQNGAYAVQLSGYLTISTLHNYKAIDMVVTQRDTTATGLCKKDPLRRWFTMFKCSMQNFNLKERLQMKASSMKERKDIALALA